MALCRVMEGFGVIMYPSKLEQAVKTTEFMITGRVDRVDIGSAHQVKLEPKV